jgi:hypothetical protein
MASSGFKRWKNSTMREENERLKRGLLGKKAEKLPHNDAQLSLAILGLMLDGGDEPAPPPPRKKRRRSFPSRRARYPSAAALRADSPARRS